MINPNSHKTSFDIRLPHDPQSKCNKFITKGYSTCLCLLNISIKVGISIAILMILLSQLNPQEVLGEISRSLSNKNQLANILAHKVFKDVSEFKYTKNSNE